MKKLTNLIVTIILTLSILLCCGCTDENTNSQLSDNSVIYNEDGSLVEDTSKGDSSVGDREEQDNEQNDNQSNNQQSSGSGNNNQSSAASGDTGCKKHKDSNKDEICDVCKLSVIVYVDFYNINDLHGKLDDGDGHIGVDELTTYLKNARNSDDNALFVSTGDMWQGQAESNMTKGIIMTDWMNELDFTAMAIGNHEYDWGGEYIQNNADFAEFPLLAINIYDRATNKLASYCEPSVMVDLGQV